MNFYNTIEEEGLAEYKDRGSKFLAHAIPFTEKAMLKKYLQQLKKEHPKAAHFCFAWRIGITGNDFRANDGGEPSGTAGKPILGQIDSKGLTDVLITVIRYFGGTLLGVPGLIAAYRSASSMVLQTVPVVRKPVLFYFRLEFDYLQTNEVLAILKYYDCIISSHENQLFSSVTTGVPMDNKVSLFHKIQNLRNVNISILEG